MQTIQASTTTCQMIHVNGDVVSVLDAKGEKAKALGLNFIFPKELDQEEKIRKILRSAEFALMEMENVNGVAYCKKLHAHQHWNEIISKHGITELAIMEKDGYHVVASDVDLNILNTENYIALCKRFFE